MRELNEEPYSYCSVYYSKDNFLIAYDGIVYPLPTVVTWNIPHEVKNVLVLPLKTNVQPGRPKKMCKALWESKTEYKCSRCGFYNTIKRPA